MAKKQRIQKAFIGQINLQSTISEPEISEPSTPEETGTIDDVNWLINAHYIHDIDEIKIRHDKTFNIRQNLMKSGKSVQISEQFPRFFDVDDLVGYIFLLHSI